MAPFLPVFTNRLLTTTANAPGAEIPSSFVIKIRVLFFS
jgi:hypothetical protein